MKIAISLTYKPLEGLYYARQSKAIGVGFVYCLQIFIYNSCIPAQHVSTFLEHSRSLTDDQLILKNTLYCLHRIIRRI